MVTLRNAPDRVSAEADRPSGILRTRCNPWGLALRVRDFCIPEVRRPAGSRQLISIFPKCTTL